jgi:hypothetical protein
LRFQATISDFAKEKSVPIPDGSIFDFYYSVGKKSWRKWRDVNRSRFYDDPSTIADLEPEHLMIDPTTFISSVFFANLMLSQGRSLLLDCADPRLSRVFCNISVNTDCVGAHYTQFCYQYPSLNATREVNPLRRMVDQSLGGIRDGYRGSSRLPLLVLIRFSPEYSQASELLRSVLDSGHLLNLRTFSQEIATSLRYVLTSNLSVPMANLNHRLLRHFVVLRLPPGDDESLVRSVSRALEALCDIDPSAGIARSSRTLLRS